MLSDPARDFAAAFTAIADLTEKAETGKITSGDVNEFPTDPVTDMALGILHMDRRDYLRGVITTSVANHKPAPVVVVEPEPKAKAKKTARKK